MRRGRRQKKESNNFKYTLYLSGGILLVLIITFVATFITYNNKLKESTQGLIALEKTTDIVPNDTQLTNSEQASSDIGKSIEEAINSIEGNSTTDEELKQDVAEEKAKTESKVSNQNTAKLEKPKDPEFVKPVKGEIVKEFAKDNLVFSETLQEWVVHLGIDIKANRTTVVKAAEAGTVTAIKSDPRYGLTIVIEHTNGYKTVYSNLLTSEFVKEGEKVKKGQSVGTVGNSAAFEIVDSPHLHFEILKDNVNVDPKIYIK